MKRLSLLTLTLQNLKRKPYRAMVIGLCVAVATGSLFAATLLLRGVQTSLSVGRARLGADLVVVPQGYETPAQEAFITGQASTFYMDGAVEAQIAALPGVQQTSVQVFVESLSNARCCIGKFFLVGFDPETDFTLAPWLTTHLQSASLGPHEMIVGDRILLRPTESTPFYGTVFTVAGVLEKTGMGIDRTVYLPLAGMREMIARSPERAEQALTIAPDAISTVLVKVEPGADVLDVAEAIEGSVSGVQVFTASHLNQAVGRQLQGVLLVTAVVLAALWLMALLTIGLVFSLIVNERQRELGLLRAMGAHRGFVFRLVMSEATLLTGLGGAIGLLGIGAVLLASSYLIRALLIQSPDPLDAFARLIQLQMNIPYLLPRWGDVLALVLAMLGLAVLTGALASLHPALASSRMEPYAAIRQGE